MSARLLLVLLCLGVGVRFCVIEYHSSDSRTPPPLHVTRPTHDIKSGGARGCPYYTSTDPNFRAP